MCGLAVLEPLHGHVAACVATLAVSCGWGLTRSQTQSCSVDVRIIGYHQTSPAVAQLIRASGFRCGAQGALGPGIYFALSEQDTVGKAHKRGYMLVCEVNVGRTKVVDKWNGALTKRALKKEGFDSVYITGGQASQANRPEYVVYSPRRVKLISHGPLKGAQGSGGCAVL